MKLQVKLMKMEDKTIKILAKIKYFLRDTDIWENIKEIGTKC